MTRPQSHNVGKRQKRQCGRCLRQSFDVHFTGFNRLATVLKLKRERPGVQVNAGATCLIIGFGEFMFSSLWAGL